MDGTSAVTAHRWRRVTDQFFGQRTLQEYAMFRKEYDGFFSERAAGFADGSGSEIGII